jgi:hypothetical protein
MPTTLAPGADRGLHHIACQHHNIGGLENAVACLGAVEHALCLLRGGFSPRRERRILNARLDAQWHIVAGTLRCAVAALPNGRAFRFAPARRERRIPNARLRAERPKATAQRSVPATFAQGDGTAECACYFRPMLRHSGVCLLLSTRRRHSGVCLLLSQLTACTAALTI